VQIQASVPDAPQGGNFVQAASFARFECETGIRTNGNGKNVVVEWMVGWWRIHNREGELIVRV